jgi:hypothetical protein
MAFVGSVSNTTTFFPDSARAAPTLACNNVLPTPPLGIVKVRILNNEGKKLDYKRNNSFS